MSTRGELRDIIRSNLADAGLGTYYTDDEINASIQDAYNEIVAKTLCNIKSSLAIAWPVAGTPYFDFLNDYAITDYLGTYAIFNNNTNFWLRDDISIRDLNRIRRDWEAWRGQPLYWTPHSLQRIVVIPTLTTGSGTFDLWYYATAPVMASDSDVPIIAADNHSLIEWYSTADLIETAEEVAKASLYWAQYEPNKEEYKARCHNIAQSNLALRI